MNKTWQETTFQMVSAKFKNLDSRFKNLMAQLHFDCVRLSKSGFLQVLKKIFKKTIILLLGLLLFPIAVILHALGYRRINVFTERIGHLALEPEMVLKEESLGLIKKRHWILLAPNKLVANETLLHYWKERLCVVSSPIGCFLIHCLSALGLMLHDVRQYMHNPSGLQRAYGINALWRGKQPILKLSQDDQTWSDEQLRLLGIPNGSWFVCVHAREAGFSPIDEPLHAHRNSSIEALIPAIQEITRRGGFVIRLGDSSMGILSPMPQVIDYAHHELKSDRLDVALCARAKFILGNTSGIFLLGSVFGTPCALANMIPMSTLGFTAHDLSIPKLHALKGRTGYLSFSEVMNSDISNFRYAKLFSENEIILEENSEEDILELAKEMMDLLEGKFFGGSNGEILQKKYMALFKPGHYAYGAVSRVANSFLSKHQYLL